MGSWKPYQLNNIEVARNDFKNAQTWNDAIAKCKGLGNGWRLPTLDELNKLYNNKDKIGGFKDSYFDNAHYWSSTEYDNDYAWSKNMFNGEGGQVVGYRYLTYNVRAVRSK